jgi:hypothetical protein
MGFETCQYCSSTLRRSRMLFCEECGHYVCDDSDCKCGCYYLPFATCSGCKKYIPLIEYKSLPDNNKLTCKVSFCKKGADFCLNCTSKITNYCCDCMDEL